MPRWTARPVRSDGSIRMLTVDRHPVRIAAANALELIGQYDLVIDGSDNFATRYLVSDACYFAGKPLITGALGVFDAALTTLRAA